MTPWDVPPRTGGAIETRYAGCRFRSRLEARYAVAFDGLGAVWHYEPETYDIPGYGWYLPDFLLPAWPDFRERRPPMSVLLEIKPKMVAGRSMERLIAFGELVRAGRIPGVDVFALAAGTVPRSMQDERDGDDCLVITSDEGPGWATDWLHGPWLFAGYPDGERLERALTVARSHRFGERAR